MHQALTFRALFPDTGCANFRIKKSRYPGRLKDHPFSLAVLELVKIGLDDKSLYEVRFKNNELKIIFHDRNDWYRMADQVLAFDF